MGIGHGELRATNPLALDDIVRLSQAGRIEEANGEAGKIKIDMQHVPSGTRHVRHDCHITLGKMIEQAGKEI